MLSFDSIGGVILLQGGGAALPLLLPLLIIALAVAFVLRARAQKPKVSDRIEIVTDPSISRQVSALMKRYRDAYIVARVTNGFGGMIKSAGVIIAVLLVLLGFMIASNSRPSDPMAILGIVGIVFGIITGALFYIIGVLVSAQGQILKASLDSAVNSSPFLANEHRAKIMSLPEA
jgi:hypothetical protein